MPKYKTVTPEELSALKKKYAEVMKAYTSLVEKMSAAEDDADEYSNFVENLAQLITSLSQDCDIEYQKYLTEHTVFMSKQTLASRLRRLESELEGLEKISESVTEYKVLQGKIQEQSLLPKRQQDAAQMKKNKQRLTKLCKNKHVIKFQKLSTEIAAIQNKAHKETSRKIKVDVAGTIDNARFLAYMFIVLYKEPNGASQESDRPKLNDGRCATLLSLKDCYTSEDKPQDTPPLVVQSS